MTSAHLKFNDISKSNSEASSVKQKIEDIKSILKLLSTTSEFNNNSWFFDLRTKGKNYSKDKFTVYFKNIPIEYKNIVKLHVLVLAQKSISNATDFPSKVIHIFNFCEKMGIEVKNFDYKHFQLLEDFINNLKQEKKGTHYHYDTRYKIWKFSITFFSTFSWLDNLPYLENLQGKVNPIKNFNYIDRREAISDDTLGILDKYFYNDEHSLHLKLAYWIMRFFPHRISEILNLELDCLKDLNDDFSMISIPIFKNNGGYRNPKLETDLLDKRDSHQVFLLNLIKSQQLEVKTISNIKNKPLDMLFHYENKNNIYLLTRTYFSKLFRRICQKLNITESITVHQFRTTGITLRAENGYTAIQLKELLHTTIDNVATYSKPRKEQVRKLQRKFLNEEEKKVYFNGRIINSKNTIMEKKIIQNPLAHKLPNMGYCSYENNCGQHYDCLDCKYLLPDYNLLEYYQETALNQLKKAAYWAEKENKLFEKDSLHRATLFTKLYEKVLLAKEN
ncbi:hypothetical protein ALC152_19950 [Arcobacter sp. 15-2]|uniref:hypothetical protein n=1 Tax=Arcobacter sp. 15-2 TaxID=3374109 RepID=UPI00399D1B0E